MRVSPSPSKLNQFEPRLSIAKEQDLGRAVGATIDDVQWVRCRSRSCALNGSGLMPAKPRTFAPATTLSKESMDFRLHPCG